MRRVLDAVAAPLRWLYRGCGMLAAVALIALGLLVLTSVVSRFVGWRILGLTSYATYALSASWFLALAYTFGEGGHIRVNLLISRLSGRAKLIAEAWCLSVALIISGMLTWYTYQLAHVSWLIRERSQAADATLLWIPQIGMVVGTAVLTLAIFEKLLRLVFLGEAKLDAESEIGPDPIGRDRGQHVP